MNIMEQLALAEEEESFHHFISISALLLRSALDAHQFISQTKLLADANRHNNQALNNLLRLSLSVLLLGFGFFFSRGKRKYVFNRRTIFFGV